MLASSVRLIMRQLFLGRGPADEVHKGMTGNQMIISQPSPSYDQVLPNMANVSEGLVVLFCKSIDDVSKAEMLVVNRFWDCPANHHHPHTRTLGQCRCQCATKHNYF